MFEKLIENLKVELKGSLPGKEAQFKMAPAGRRTDLQREMKLAADPTLSAVLILLYPKDNEPHICLILRNAYEGVHSQQVGFPGGKKEDLDESLEHTALREAGEEVGIDKDQVTLIGSLSQLFIPPSGFLVYPYVGYSMEHPDFKLDQREVAKLIEMPVKRLGEEDVIKEKYITPSSGPGKMLVPYFDIDGHTVWGATAMIMSEFREILKRIT